MKESLQERASRIHPAIVGLSRLRLDGFDGLVSFPCRDNTVQIHSIAITSKVSNDLSGPLSL